MTAQIEDLFRYQGIKYSVAGTSEGELDELFDPSLLALTPVGVWSDCWRGFQAVFAIVDSQLVLDTLHMNLLAGDEDYGPQKGLPINGVSPTGSRGKYDFFNNHYVGIGYHLEYTGGLLLADGFIQDLYVHMDFHPAWKHTNVVELVFETGVLQNEFDRSERMAEIRQLLLDSGRSPTDTEMLEFVKRSFDRTYRM